MAKYLVIVESPAKVKTIKKFLGSNYEVMASQGHVRDLPKSQMGVDVEHDFEPKYITIRGKGEILAALRKEVKKADKVYLATDPDREGEAISWHLSKALKLEDKDIYRITFNEITKSAVKAAIKDARKIDMNLVDAQQARRVLDRVVGYSISPVLWAKIKRGLSAGRVQSVALRIICDRENEIDAFIPDEYWTMDATLKVKGEKKPIVARFHGDVNGKIDIKNKEQMETIKKEVENSTFAVDSIKKGEKVKKAPLPFTTSTLQQEASKTLNFATAKTMRIAQQLYEGVDVDGRGTIGVITYLRTDSTRVADEAKEASEQYIAANYGEKYLPHSGLRKKDDKKIQDAHEAIRPTDIALTPVMIKDSLSRDQFRLYQLIWKRFTASQMAEAIYETTSVKIAAGDYRFSIAASKITFDGFMSVYRSDDDKDEPDPTIPTMNEITLSVKVGDNGKLTLFNPNYIGEFGEEWEEEIAQYITVPQDLEINWGDGQTTNSTTHQYDLGGIYQVTIKGTGITSFIFESSKLQNIDITKAPNLVVFSIYWNQVVKTLDVSRNFNLAYLMCEGSKLTSLDVSKNTKLKVLNCENNNLSSIDVSKNIELVELACDNTNLTSLDVSCLLYTSDAADEL